MLHAATTQMVANLIVAIVVVLQQRGVVSNLDSKSGVHCFVPCHRPCAHTDLQSEPYLIGRAVTLGTGVGGMGAWPPLRQMQMLAVVTPDDQQQTSLS